MNNIADILKKTAALADGEPLETSEATALADAIMSRPYFAAAGVALLRHLPADFDDDMLADIRHRVALAAADNRTILAAKYGDAWTKFYPCAEEDGRQDTTDVIDTFLRTYGSCTPEEEAQLERLIFNPTPDYAELLARQEQEELPEEEDDGAPGSQEALINAFIRSQHPKSAAVPEYSAEEPEKEEESEPAHRPEPSDDSLLSESLAKIFIKQGRYERAYEIISGLNLKFPKKSAYFADQLRFLHKLIINQRRLAELAGDGDRN